MISALLEKSLTKHFMGRQDLQVVNSVSSIVFVEIVHSYGNAKHTNCYRCCYSPKLAARTAVLPFTYASSTLALGAVCHLLVSSLACWPIFGWTPGLFQCLLENVPAPTSLALGPKEACSVLCLLVSL